MDWRDPLTALIPGLEGSALHHLWTVREPRTASQVYLTTRRGSLSGIRRALERLTRQGVVVARGAGNVILFELNREHVAYPAIDAALARYEPFTELCRRIADLTATHAAKLVVKPTVAIYGSVARGDATTESDLDLLLVLDDSTPEPLSDDLEARLRESGERWTGNHVHVFRCTTSWLADAQRRQDPLVASWLTEAQTVHGRPLRDLLAGAA